MKKLVSILFTVATLSAVVTLYSCGEDEPAAPPKVATLTTAAVTGITSSGATSGGNISDDGNALVTARGVCWSTTENPTVDDSKTTDGTGNGEFESTITGLEPGVTYYVRAYATNEVGTAYGEQVELNTLAEVPTVDMELQYASFSWATLSGDVTDDGGAALTERGFCWSTNMNPTVDDTKITQGATGPGAYEAIAVGLEMNTTYYVRAYAINSAGVGYGDELTFTTTDFAIDNDGNEYELTTIGEQVWTTSNLKTTTYNNGDDIVAGSLAAYDDEQNNIGSYGYLYKGTVLLDTRGVCPIGTHVPSVNEWQALIAFAGGSVPAMIALSEAGNEHWTTGDYTDDYGFTALPGGIWAFGQFYDLGVYGFYWTSSNDPADNTSAKFAQFIGEGVGASVASAGLPKEDYGISIRCIVD